MQLSKSLPICVHMQISIVMGMVSPLAPAPPLPLPISVPLGPGLGQVRVLDSGHILGAGGRAILPQQCQVETPEGVAPRELVQHPAPGELLAFTRSVHLCKTYALAWSW